MIRREFIYNVGAAFLGSPWAVSGFLPSIATDKPPIGIILNTVAREMKADHIATLRKLKEFGYQYLEGSFYGPSATEYKRLTDDLGLRCLAGGSAMGNLDQNLDQYLKTAETLEYQYLVCYYPWLTSNDEIDLPASYQAAENLNRLGKIIKQAGFGFAWHPHNWEFVQREGGQRAFDIIMQNTDPQLVSLQLDLYWVAKGGSDAIKEMNRYPGRTKMFHAKDMGKDADQKIECVGEGQIDFKPIFQYAQDHEIEFWLVENETPDSSVECARKAIDHLNRIS